MYMAILLVEYWDIHKKCFIVNRDDMGNRVLSQYIGSYSLVKLLLSQL